MATPEWMDGDLENMLDLDDFAVEAECSGGTVNAIFDDEYAETLDMQGSSPALWVRSSEATRVSLAVGQTVTVDGDEYTVARVKAEGAGMSVVVLMES